MANRLVIPMRARTGDTVAIVSPSAPGVAWWPHRVARGRAYVESLGLKVRLMRNAGKGGEWAAGTPQERAADIHEAFLDDDVSVVLASIGGDRSNQVLPYLDFDLISAHPKIFQGYSDITVLLWAVAVRAGLRTFYGPTLTTELGEFPGVLPYTDRAMRAAWFGAAPEPFEPAFAWTDERLDLFRKVDLTRSRHMSAGSGWRTIRAGVAEGTLFGGCLETICRHLEGSAYWPDLRGVLLFLETSDEAPTPAEVDAYLSGLERLGVFAGAAGLVFGRPYHYGAAQKEALWAVVRERTAASGIPVLADVDIGHTDPMLTLPIGAWARIDAGALEFALLEPATSWAPESGLVDHQAGHTQTGCAPAWASASRCGMAEGYREGDKVRVKDWVPVYGGRSGKVSRVTRAGGKTVTYIAFADGSGNFFSARQVELA